MVEVGKDHNMTEERARKIAASGIRDILAEQAKIDDIMKKAQDKCKPFRVAIATIKKDTREACNYSAPVLNAKITLERNKQKHEARVARLDDHDLDCYRQLEIQFDKES